MKDSIRDKGIRLQVYLARCGLGSRRRCEDYIREKRVSINGNVTAQQGQKVLETDAVLFDGALVRPVSCKLYIALNKPERFLCSSSDRFGRPLAVDLIQESALTRIFHIGRLDFMSSGLVLFTNDGKFAHSVAHPSFEIEKEYLVETKNLIEEKTLSEFLEGIRIDSALYTLKRYEMVTPRKVKLILNEGRNREIRRVFDHLHIEIRRIHRVRIGIVTVKGLESGKSRMLTQKEILWFQKR